jgi:putative PIN family toxin of toxin-antitoxin system
MYNTIMARHYRIVIDTNVLVTAMKSKQGASYALFMLLGSNTFTACISVPLVVEYEKLLSDRKHKFTYKKSQIADVLDYVCSVAERTAIYYLWRPFLHDAKDDMVLEVAVAAQSDFIVTYNVKDFVAVEKQFGIKVMTPKEFLIKIGGIK